MKRLAVGVVLAGLYGCGGGAAHVPCSGTGCDQVAGSYLLTLTPNAALSTCKNIVYGNVDADGHLQVAFTLTQNGSSLTFQDEGGFIATTATGTLFADHTAEFKEHLPHIHVSRSGEAPLDYSDDTSIQLTFVPSGDSFSLVGSLRDAMVSNGTTDTDPSCTLDADVTASIKQ